MSFQRAAPHRRRLARRAAVVVSAVLVAGAVAASVLGDEAPAPARQVLTAATTSPAPAPETSPVADDDAAVSACLQAVRRETGRTVDRSVALELGSTPGGWRITVVVESGESFDCHVTRAGETEVEPTPAVRGDVRTQLGLQHLACRAVEPGLLAVSTGAPGAEQQARAALAQALPHLAPDTARAVVGPHRSEPPVVQLEAIYGFCLDRGWGGNRALLDG